LIERQQRAKKEREERDRVQLHKLKKLFALESFEFEREIAKLHEKLGYKVEQTKATGDGGKDAIMWKDKTKYLLECKKYRTGNQVGRRDIQIFHSAILTDNAEGGFFVTTSDFSKEAREYVEDHKLNINLINMQGLSRLIEEATSINAHGHTIEGFVGSCSRTLLSTQSFQSGWFVAGSFCFRAEWG
jgi:restriction endonuclease Mrr